MIEVIIEDSDPDKSSKAIAICEKALDPYNKRHPEQLKAALAGRYSNIFEAVKTAEGSAISLLMAALEPYARQHSDEIDIVLNSRTEEPVAPATDDNLEDVLVNRLEREKEASTKKKILA